MAGLTVDATRRLTELKRERDAVVLVHNYQLPEVQDVADIRGDSLGLSVAAAETDAAVIVFCGVWFMGETAKILSPDRTVLVPVPDAGCPLADTITGAQLAAFQAEHPGAKTVCYVNSSAEIKAMSDVCCTSSNAVEVTAAAAEPGEQVLFVPDRNLAAWVAKRLPDREIVPWKGFCPTHHRLLPEMIERSRADHPGAEVLVHPECRPAVCDLADHVLSTGGMSRHVTASERDEFVIGTELGMLYRLGRDNPDKHFHPVFRRTECRNMKKTTLGSVVAALERMRHPVTLDAALIERAGSSIRAMLSHAG